jgi:hypothetical protein
MKIYVVLFLLVIAVSSYANEKKSVSTEIDFSLRIQKVEKLVKSDKNMAICGTVFLPVSIVPLAAGTGFMCLTFLPELTEYYAWTFGVVGGLFLSAGVIFLIIGLPFTICGWQNYKRHKKQLENIKFSLGVTSGGTGELSCDKKRNALEKPSGVKLAMSVKF